MPRRLRVAFPPNSYTLNAVAGAYALTGAAAALTYGGPIVLDTWVDLGASTNYLTWANANIPAGAYQGTAPKTAIVDAFCDPAVASAAAYFYGGGHGDGTCNAVIKFDFSSLGYSLVGQPTPPAKYPPSYVNGGSDQPGPLTYPSGLSGQSFFLDGSLLTDPADTAYITPLARASSHMYAAAAMRGGVIHYFYGAYAEFNTAAGTWSGRGVDLGAQLPAFRTQYGSVGLQQGTVAVYDEVTDRFFVTLIPGDAGGGWRSAMLVFNPNTQTIQASIEYDAAMGVMSESASVVRVGRDLYVFNKQAASFTDPQAMSSGVIFDMDAAAALSGLQDGTGSVVTAFTTTGADIGTYSPSTTQETMPAWWDGIAIRRWNYASAKRQNIYSVNPTPASGSGTVASPYLLTQTERVLSGTPPATVQTVYKRTAWDAANSRMLVLPSGSSNWYSVRLS